MNQEGKDEEKFPAGGEACKVIPSDLLQIFKGERWIWSLHGGP